MCSQAYFLFDMHIMYFAWRMSALQCWVSFCSPAVGLSCMLRMCAYPLSCAALLPAAFPGSSQSPSAARVLCRSPAAVCLIHGRDVCPRCSLHWFPYPHACSSHLCLSSCPTQLHQYHFCTFWIYWVFFFFLLEARIIEFTTPYLSYNFLKKLKGPI